VPIGPKYKMGKQLQATPSVHKERGWHSDRGEDPSKRKGHKKKSYTTFGCMLPRPKKSQEAAAKEGGGGITTHPFTVTPSPGLLRLTKNVHEKWEPAIAGDAKRAIPEVQKVQSGGLK